MLKEAHNDILNLELKQDCVGICYTIKKRMIKNYNVANIVGLKHELLNREATQLMASAIRKISVLPANKLTTAAVQHSLSILGKVLCANSSSFQENCLCTTIKLP